MQTLKHMPGHTSREVLIIFSSLTTCDPSNIYDLIKTLKTAKIRVSVIGLSAEVRVCTVLARETGGTYHVILDETHYKELLAHHVSPLLPAQAPSAHSFAWDSLSIPLLLCLIRMQNHPSAWRIWITTALSQGLHWEATSAHSAEQSTASFLLNVKYVVLLWCLHLIWQDLTIIYFLWMLFKKFP